MLRLLMLTALLAPAAGAAFSWHYNQHGGFGLYRPEGWALEETDRRVRITGPAKERSRSEITAGSDYQARVRSLPELEAYAKQEAAGLFVVPRENSGLAGYGFEGPDGRGAVFFLREPKNVIELRYVLRGSPAQVEEGREILSSLEIRTGGIEYPQPLRDGL